MGKGISKPIEAHELEPVSLSELIHQHVRAAIETAVHEELRAALATAPFIRAQRGSAWLPQWHQGTHAHGTDRPDRTHAIARHAVPAVRREGMDVGDPPALSAADAGGE